MTSRFDKTERSEDHLLVAAYSMDALDDTERERFERHLAHCQSCAEELRGFGETAARLATATSIDPPESLKAKTLSAADRTPQLPRRATKKPGRGSRTRILQMAAAVAVVALAIAAGIFANGQRTSQHRLNAARHNNAMVQRVLSSPDAKMLSAQVTTGGSAHVVMSASNHALVFSASALRPLDRSKGYELWVMSNGRDEPAGMIPGPKPGSVGPILMNGIQSGAMVGLCVEPAAGTAAPTTPMILAMNL